jgi:hypothetical protein
MPQKFAAGSISALLAVNGFQDTAQPFCGFSYDLLILSF